MADSKKTTKKTVVSKKEVEVKTIDTLKTELIDLQNQHLESRKSHVAGELVNPRVLTVQRKSIARLHTAINAMAQSATKEEN